MRNRQPNQKAVARREHRRQWIEPQPLEQLEEIARIPARQQEGRCRRRDIDRPKGIRDLHAPPPFIARRSAAPIFAAAPGEFFQT